MGGRVKRSGWSYIWASIPLATLLFGCGRTDLGEHLGFGGIGGAGAGTLVTGSGASSGSLGPGSEGSGNFGSGSFVAASTIGSSASTNSTSTVVGTTLSTSSVTTGSGGQPTTTGSGGAPSTTTGSAGAAGAGGASSWGEPVLIETDEPRGAWQVQIAMNDDGAAVVALFDYRSDSISSVWAVPYTRDAGWSDAELLATDDRLGGASVAIDDEGTAVVVWQGPQPAPNLWSMRYGVGSGWEAPESVNPDAVLLGGGPSIAMDATGSAVVVWSEYDGTKGTVWSNRHAPAAGWGNAIPIYETTHTTGARLAMSRTGHAISIWPEWDDSEPGIRSSRSEAGANWTLPEPVSGSSDTVQSPDIAVDPGGNGMAVWNQLMNSGTRVWANRFVAGVAWHDPQIIDTAPLVADQATVGVDSDGSAVAVWRQSDGIAATIWSNRYSVDSGWGEAVQISNRTDACYMPALAVGSAGDAVAAWAQLQTDTGAISVWSNRYTPGVGWREPEFIDAASPGTSGSVDVGIDGAGNALAVWSHSDGGPLYVWANHSSRPED